SSFMSVPQISTGLNRGARECEPSGPVGSATPPNLGLAQPGKPHRLALPFAFAIPSKSPSERAADSFCRSTDGGVEIRVGCLLKERHAGGQEFRRNMTRLVRSATRTIDVRYADSHATDSPAETA